ncbi:senescence-related gene 1 protein [Perilla frutescens var. hirtella]|uniref:Senescence-related gene 1 protein n=1 Tax=Perilla frutescens var. hirtella TaxID=608512 RepID=A0AAD4JJE0_PERFH|nr:senescence-related gene 1 protein [Perilla frutescens var. hirtella]
MESKARMEGRSLKVPSVQELLQKEKLRSVPSRYVRPELTAFSNVPSSSQIPVIDMLNLLDVDSDSMESELRKLHEACQEWGFFQLINHGVEAEAEKMIKFEVQEFFNLPMEEKEKFRQQEDDVEGYGQVFVVSEEQKLDWGDMFFVTTFPTYLRKPHLIPNLSAPFRDAIDAYGAEVKTLAMKILGFMEKALGMKSEEMERVVFGEGMQTMRMNYYPPCPQPELVTGLSPHSDGVGLTILLQANEIEGLQVKKAGAWIPVSPLPNAFVVNIGDILEIASNGVYRSVEHRATVNSEKERLSIATFLNPAIDNDIGPAPSLVSLQTPAKFKTISAVEYLKGLFSKELKGKSYVDLLRIPN